MYRVVHTDGGGGVPHDLQQFEEGTIAKLIPSSSSAEMSEALILFSPDTPTPNPPHKESTET